MYSPQVLDHFEHPRNSGELAGAGHVIEVRNPACGDLLRLSVSVQDGRVQAARFLTRGCVSSIACSSWLAEWLEGKSAADLRGLTSETVAASLGGLPPGASHAAHLATDAVGALLHEWKD